MNIIWVLMLIGSIIMFIIGEPTELLSTCISASNKSLVLCFSLMGIYVFWLGILQIVQDSGISTYLARLLSPVIRILFGQLDDETVSLIALNIATNILGLGNASTPAGLKAMQRLDNHSNSPSKTMVMLFALNCCSLQILPTTIISLRTLHGSANSGDIILPIIIISVIGLIFCVSLCKIFYRTKRRRP